MKKFYALIGFALIAAGVARADDLEIANHAVSNITTIAADIYGEIVSTNEADPVLTLYYGTADAGTNLASWASSNLYGAAGVGIITTNITGLTPATRHYYRWHADDGATSVWASATSNFTTLAGAPTSTPTMTAQAVMADITTGALLSPLNFFIINGVPTNILALVTTLTNEFALLEAQVTTLTNDMAIAQSDIAGLTNDVALAQSDIAGLTNDVALAQSDIAGLTNDVALAQSGISTLTNDMALAQSGISTLTNDVASLWTSLYDMGASLTNLYSPYQEYTHDLIVGDGGTATVTYAMGTLVGFVVTNTPVTITFASSGYETNGVSRVGLELWAGTNSIAFDTAVITNATAPTIFTNDWTSLFFRRTADGIWNGRQ